jgi:hypothetical protein
LAGIGIPNASNDIPAWCKVHDCDEKTDEIVLLVEKI